MKKTLLTLAIMLLGLGAASAQDELASIQFTKNSTAYGKISGYKPTDIWKSTDGKWVFCSINNNNNGWDFIAAGWGTGATTPYFYTGPYAAPVSKIVVGIGTRFTKDAVTSATLYISDTDDFTNATETALTVPTAASTDWTITIPDPAENKYYKVGLVIPKQSKNGQAISFTKITVYGKSDKAEANYAFSEAVVNLPYGSTFEAPKFTCAEGAPAPTYSSDNENVAKVNSTTGEVEITGIGTAVITAASESTDKFLAGKASYTINVLKTVNSIAETMAVTDKTEKLYINYPLTLAFKRGSNNFVCNGNDFIQIYGNLDYNVGDVIPAGWVGNYELFKDATPEITNPANMQPSTENNGFTPAKANFADITVADVNKVMTIENVVFAEATSASNTNISGTVAGNTVTFFNNYKIASVPAGTYNVTFVVSIFNNAPSLYVTNYEKVDDTTGIADIVADENAPVEYFNLQGIRVDNPENGLYIRRQGNKVTKVIVK